MAGYSNGGEDANNNPLIQNKGFQSRLLRKLSNYGMDFSDLLSVNSYAIGKFEDPDDVNNNASPEDTYNVYDAFSRKVLAEFLSKKSIAYLDRSIEDKIKILKQYSIKDEIREFVTEIADESIMFDEDNYFCKITDLPETYSKDMRDKYQENFKMVYRNFSFNDGITAWQHFKTFLVEGYLAFELIYDKKQKNITKLYPLDPITLLPAHNGETGDSIWIQYPENPNQRRVLLDSQVIYISYSNSNEFAETSYVENLIKPYNQLKLLEYTRIMYNINQAAIYKKFIIPTGGMTKSQSENAMRQLMNDYHEEVIYDDTLGTVTIDGQKDIPHSKNFWFPSSPEGQPEVEIINPQGADLNEDDILNWFFRNMKRASHLPMSRFEDDSGGNIIYDNSEMTRDEIKFSRYIDRLRTVYKEILTKPLKIQMTLDFPELFDDYMFESNIKIIFNSNDLFEEWKYLNNLAKRSEIAASLTSNIVDAGDNPFFHVRWIVKNILKLSEEELDENERFKLMYPVESSGGGESGGEVQGGIGGDGEFAQGDEEFAQSQEDTTQTQPQAQTAQETEF